MKNRTATSIIALVALASSVGLAVAKESKPLPKELPPYGPERPYPVPQINESTLPNGLKVWVVPRTGVPRVVALLLVRGGTAADAKDMAGTSEVFASVLKEGTTRRSSKQIAEELQAVGAEIDTGASDDAVNVSITGLATGTHKILDVLADVATSASFPAGEVELAKTNALQSLMARESTPEFAVGKAFAKAVFGDHPYHVTSATKEAIAAVTPEALRAQFTRRFRPDRALLVVVGAIDPATTSGLIGTTFGGWKAPAGAALPDAPPVPPSPSRSILVVDRPGSVQSEIRVGRTVPGVTDPDYYPMMVANTIFGGAFGSRLTENIREDKGYTYSPGASLVEMQQGGMLRVRAAVRNDVTAATLLEMFYELDRMGVTNATDEELNRAKRYQVGLFLLRNQITSALAATLANYWVNGLQPAALAEFVPKVEGVSTAQVREVGKKYFTSASQVVVIGGDAKRVNADVAQFGEPKAATP